MATATAKKTSSSGSYPYGYSVARPSSYDRGYSRSRSPRRPPPPDYGPPRNAAPPPPAYGPPSHHGYGPPPGYGAHPYGPPPGGYGAPGYGPPPAYGGAPPGPYGAPPPAYGPPPGLPPYGAPYWPPPHPAHGDGRFIGRIKSYSEKNGFGFIDCPATYERWRRDVFIHHEWVDGGNLEVGDDISFIVEANKDGMPQARDVLRLDGRPVSYNGERRSGKGEGKQRPAKKQLKDASKDEGKGSKKKADKDNGPEVPENERTTLMLRNVPTECSRAEFMKMLDSKGFEKQYDFVYLPTSFRTWRSMGYAFANMVTPEAARKVMQDLQGFDGWETNPAGKQIDVSWSTLQGLDRHLERYRNSPVMHESVNDAYRPMHLVNGVAAPFPGPTKKLKEPRLRPRSGGNKEAPAVEGAEAANGGGGEDNGGDDEHESEDEVPD